MDMTRAILKRGARKFYDAVMRARYAETTIVDAIFACGPDGRTDMPFQNCLRLADADLRAAYDSAVSDLITAEHNAVSAGFAYRSASGGLVWHYKR